MSTYEDYLRAINADLDDMGEADLLLEIECTAWIGRHYPWKIVFIEPALYFSVAEWACERTARIHQLLVGPASAANKPVVESEIQVGPKPGPPKAFMAKAHKARPWKVD